MDKYYLCAPFSKSWKVMFSIKEYKFAYKGLGIGNHHFDFDINSDFFSKFETSNIKEAKIKAAVALERKETMIVIDFDISGSFNAPCDRCTAAIDIPISGEDQLIIKFSESENSPDDDEVMYVNPKETHIDLTNILYELIHVNVPLINIRNCEGDNYKYCDHEALDVLENQTDIEENQNENPIWKDLKNLEL